LAVVTLVAFVPAAVAYWASRDATRRGSSDATNRAISTFLFGVLGFVPVFVGPRLSIAVREEFEPSGGAPND
jgi:hypothetical protein